MTGWIVAAFLAGFMLGFERASVLAFSESDSDDEWADVARKLDL